MEKVEPLFRDNIKVHFAGCEVQNQFIATKAMGVKYYLYTAFPFVERKVFPKAKSPIMPLKWQKENPYIIPQYIIENSIHTIQDSGLFTLMFGSQKGKKDEQLMNKWYNELIEFTLQYGKGATCVEVDCQKILGVEKAWEFRERMRRDIPNRIINVFHKEDGQKGLDRLIEYSDYIAISVPELRFAKQKKYTDNIAHYIKRKKPGIDIHLLGCTELEMIKRLNFCTSCDSTTYIAPKRFGYLEGKQISRINPEKVRKLVGDKAFDEILEYNKESNTCALLLSIYNLQNQYVKYAGNQDY